MGAAASSLWKTDKDASYLEDVIKKVRRHPGFKKLSSAADVKLEAKRLTSMETIMKKYFSEYFTIAQDDILQTTKEQNGALQDTTAVHAPDGDTIRPDTDGVQVSTNQAASVTENSEGSINTTAPEDLQVTSISGSVLQVTTRPNADDFLQVSTRQLTSVMEQSGAETNFTVKLYLTSLPADPTDDRAWTALENLYEPLHASLQIGHTMIEWTPHSLVVPHPNIPSESVIKSDITKTLNISSEIREKVKAYRRSNKNGTVTGEVDLMFEVTKSISFVIHEVVEVVVSWNRYKHFDAYGSNSQQFVQNVIKKLGIEELQLPNHNLNAYIGRLKGEFKSMAHRSFISHAELDNYTKQRIGDLSTSEMEYLLTEYYRFHIASRAEAVHKEGQWKCMEKDCQVQILQREVDGKELLITSLT
jgi:hypothetical protein